MIGHMKNDGLLRAKLAQGALGLNIGLWELLGGEAQRLGDDVIDGRRVGHGLRHPFALSSDIW
jgi:hypothetical protein